MRKFLFCCSVGLLGMSSIAGCGLFRGWNDDTQKKNVQLCVTPPPSKMKSPPVVVGTESVPITGPATPHAAKTLPEAPEALATLPAPPIPAPSVPVAPIKTPAIDLAPITEKITAIPKQEQPIVPKTDIGATIVGNERPIEIPAQPEAKQAPVLPRETPVAIKTAPASMGQTEQFKSITGEVQVFRTTRRLRYAAIDQADIYGGVVVLEGDAEVSKLRDGQHVRVRGELIPPTTRVGSAIYRVASLEILD